MQQYCSITAGTGEYCLCNTAALQPSTALCSGAHLVLQEVTVDNQSTEVLIISSVAELSEPLTADLKPWSQLVLKVLTSCGMMDELSCRHYLHCCNFIALHSWVIRCKMKG